MEQVTLKVAGMTCNGCVASVTRVLAATPGVSEVAVDLASGQAKVAFDPAKTAPAALKTAIEDAGYDVVA